MSETHQWPLEPTGSEMRQLTTAAMARIVDHINSLPDQPSAGVWGEVHDLARSLREEIPEHGAEPESVLNLLFDRAAPVSFNTAGPGYLAYIPGGGIFHAALADFISGAMNRYTGVWAAAPVLVELEANVIRWLCDMVGYPSTSGGILTSGGSLSILSALVAAREAKLRDDFRDAVLYASDQVHHSVTKAAHLLGFSKTAVRTIATDEAFRIRVADLQSVIERDRSGGFSPFLVIGNAGTVNTGAVDDLDALAAVAAKEDLWFHVDAAYGGFFALTERGRRRLAGLERADSITLDPHKGLFLPYGTGGLLVRERRTLTEAHEMDAGYLPTMQADEDLFDFCQMSPELSRPYRGLRIWLPFKLVGATAFRDQLNEKLDLAQWVTERLRVIPGVEIIAEPQLSTVAFRHSPPGVPDDACNEINRAWLERINRRGRVYMTGTEVRGRFVLRICVLSFRTHMDRMRQGIDDIRVTMEEGS